MLLGDARHKPNRNPGNFSGLDASSTSLCFAPANVDCGEESMRSLAVFRKLPDLDRRLTDLEKKTNK